MLPSAEFIAGSQVCLRAFRPDDLTERYLGWLNDPEVTRYMESGTFPSTMRDLESFYQRIAASRSDVLMAVVDQATGEHIGNVKLGPIQWVHRSAIFGIMIGEKRFWGRGVGIETTRLMVEYGFGRLNLNRIDLGVFAEHEAGVRCYQKLGFKVEGRLRQDLFQDGAYKDRLWMGLLRSDYIKIEIGRPT
jgi:ribosomal-protein-alanine N-acetyltransferase